MWPGHHDGCHDEQTAVALWEGGLSPFPVGAPLSLEDIGIILGVTGECVRQIIEKLMKKLAARPEVVDLFQRSREHQHNIDSVTSTDDNYHLRLRYFRLDE